MADNTAGKTLQCVVVTPERAVLDEPADFVSIPLYDGELGVLPGRQPLIGRLGCGELRYTQKGVTHRFFVDGGFVQIKNNVVTVLTSKAVKAEDLKVDASAPAEKTPEARLKAESRLRTMKRIAAKAGA